MARVAMVVSNRFDPDPRVYKEARALADAGHDVTILAFDRRRELPTEEALGTSLTLQRVRPPLSMPPNMLATAAGLGFFRGEVRRRLSRWLPDVVHCHDQDTCSVGRWWQTRGARGAGLSRGLFIFDAHDLYWTWATLPNPRARWRRAIAAGLRWSDRRHAQAADLLITVTEGVGEAEGTAESYRAWGCDPLVIWNAPTPPEVVAPLPGRFTVGYVGNVREPRMFRLLVDAIERMPQALRPDLRIAGTGRSQGEVAEMLRTASQQLGFRLTVTGTFHMDQLHELMAQCSVQFCVYPTERGNVARAMPVKLLDSVASGRRVIGNRGTLMSEWIAARQWGWSVAEDDPEMLASALLSAREASVPGEVPALESPPVWSEQADRLVRAYAGLLGTGAPS